MKITLKNLEEDLIQLCEDNDVIIEEIKNYFSEFENKESTMVDLKEDGKVSKCSCCDNEVCHCGGDEIGHFIGVSGCVHEELTEYEKHLKEERDNQLQKLKMIRGVLDGFSAFGTYSTKQYSDSLQEINEILSEVNL